MSHHQPRLPIIFIAPDLPPQDDNRLWHDAWGDILKGPPPFPAEFILWNHRESKTFSCALPPMILCPSDQLEATIISIGTALSGGYFHTDITGMTPADILTRLHDWAQSLRTTKIHFQNLTISLKDGTARDGQQDPLMLTELEAHILLYLAWVTTPVSAQHLLTHVWHYHQDIDSHSVQTAIYRLREKLSIYAGTSARELINVSDTDRQGYCLHQEADLEKAIKPRSLGYGSKN